MSKTNLVYLSVILGGSAIAKLALIAAEPRPGIVEANELTPRQVLGMKLFFDPALSSNGKVSCATCHDPEHGFASHGRPIGLDGFPLTRKAPSLYLKGFGKSFFWDGREPALERQALGPILNRKEMGNTSISAVLERLEPKYGESFRENYKAGLNANTLGHVIAEYELTLKAPDSRLEEHLSGRGDYTESELRGYDLFRGKAGCYKCHPMTESGLTLSDEKYHNTGLGSLDWSTGFDLGRYAVTKREEDKGKFKTPGLRGCKYTAPYMHDGSLKTLEDVVNFYDRGGDTRHAGVKDVLVFPLRLTPREREDLVSFLKGL